MAHVRSLLLEPPPSVLRRNSHTAWISAAIALFLVLVLPACWYGALTRSFVAGSAPLTSNNNEEREEHEERKVDELTESSDPPPPPQRTARLIRLTRVARVMHSPTVKTSVAAKVHVSQFSVRRLI